MSEEIELLGRFAEYIRGKIGVAHVKSELEDLRKRVNEKLREIDNEIMRIRSHYKEDSEKIHNEFKEESGKIIKELLCIVESQNGLKEYVDEEIQKLNKRIDSISEEISVEVEKKLRQFVKELFNAFKKSGFA